MSLMGKKLDRRKLSTLLTVLMIMFMMVSSVFTSKLIIAEDEGTDTDTDINLPIDDPQEAFLLKEHLNGESFVEVSGNRILLSDVSEENNEFDFFGDEAEFVLLLSVNLNEEDENEYTYTLPEGVSIDVESLKTSDDLQARLEGNVLTVKKVKVDTPVDNNEDVPAEDSDTPLDNNDIDDNQVNDDLPLDDQLDNNNQSDDDLSLDDQLDNNNQSDDDLDVVPADDNSGDTDKNTNENTDNNTNDDTDLNKEDDTQNNGGTALDLPEYKTYVELSGTVLPETETFIVEAFGTFNKAAMMMLRGPLGAPKPALDEVTVDKHLIGRSESGSLYTYVRFGTQTFPLPKRVTNPTEELNKSIEKLTEVPREVEVNLVWNVDLDDEYPDNTITEDTAFIYKLPDGIRWNWEEFPPEERVIRDTKNPSVINGHFEIDQENNTITAHYSQAFLTKAYDSVDKKFTTYINISGSVTEAMWDDTGDQPYHFEGVGSFDPEREEATTRLKVTKNLKTADGKIDGLEYLGDGKYKIWYETRITGTYITDDPTSDKRIKQVNIIDTMPDGMMIAKSGITSVSMYKEDGSPVTDRGIQCTIPSGYESDTFGCVLEYIEDKETIILRYPLVLNLNALLPDDENGALSDMTRRFENDVTVSATNPAKPEETLEDTAITIDTYSMINPSKKGERDIDNNKPEEVKWVIEYNKGKFAKDSREFGGINVGGAFVKDTMGEEQDLVAETFKFSTTVDGETWTEWTVTETEGRPTTISNGSRTINVAWEDTNGDGIKNQFSFTLPEIFYELAKIEYSTKSTNEFTLVKLTNTASIASDAEGKDEKSGSGEAPGVGPGTVPMVKKTGNELGPNGNFEWTSDLTVFEDFSRNVRYYDAMEKGLELLDSQYPVEVYRVTYEDGKEVETELDDSEWQLIKNTKPVDHTYDRKDPECETNPPWLLADLEDPKYSYDWYIKFVGDPSNDNILPADGYTDKEGKQYTDRAVYRIKYYTNAPMPEQDPETKEWKTKKFYNEGQIRTKIDDKSDEKDRYNSSDDELEKKYIEKASYGNSNKTEYYSVTGDVVDWDHGYIGWSVRVYPLEAKNYIQIRDDFTYSTDQTSMKLVDGSVHVYVSENKNLPSSSEEIDSKYYRISDSSTKGFTLRINNLEAAGITKKSFIYLFYQTKVDPRVNNKSIDYINTASLIRDGDPNYPPAKTTRNRKDVVVSKGSQRSGQYVTYTIEINKQLLNIDPKNGILTIEDTRGESIEYIEGTMKFYEFNQETEQFEDVTGTKPYALVSHDKVLEVKIPDETYVKIEYEALVTKKEGDLTGDDASNTVVIKGATGFSAINHLKGRVQKARAGAFIDTDHPIIKVVKTDRNYKPLEGAEFKFTPYLVNYETGELTQDGDPIEGFVSDENGVIEFAYDQEKGIVPKYDIVYVVEETKAPKGYQIDRRPKYILFTNHPGQYEGIDMYVLDGKEIDKEDVIIESVKFLYRFDIKNNLIPPNRDIPKTGIE